MEQIHAFNFHHCPSAIEVGKRALALRAVLARRDLEYVLYGEVSEEELNDLPSELNAFLSWVMNNKVYTFLTPFEHDLIFRPLGDWGQELADCDGHFYFEEMGTLLWSLGVINEIPDLVDGYDETELVYEIEILNHPKSFLQGLNFRSFDLMERKREVTFAHFLQSAARLYNTPAKLARVIKFQTGDAEDTLLRNLIERTAKGDLPIFDQPISSFDHETLLTINQNCSRRLGALNWLLGDYQDWDTPNILPARRFHERQTGFLN